MSQPFVQVCDLHRSFDAFHAVKGLSFEIAKGEVVGFIGANGAGKTTTMRIMATLDVPSSGSIRIGGYDAANEPALVRNLIGWMPDAYGAYPDTTVLDYLDFYARAFGFKGAERMSRVREVMEFTNLDSLADRQILKLSKGMTQRLCLGRTLLHDPELLILDEPAAGLDPKARVEFKRLVRLLAAEGKTIFISSHILTELGEMCDTMLFIDDGKLVHHGSQESLLEERNGGIAKVIYDVRLAGGAEAFLSWLALQPGVELMETTRHGARVVLQDASPDGSAAFLRRAVSEGHAIAEYRREERKLEDVFVELLGSSPPSSPTP